ncbi:MAG: hypothetical protein ACOCUW_05450 [Gemmatimonadota bacterium]
MFGALALAGCTELPAGSPLANAKDSPEALARAALDALRAGDEDRLAALMITRDEYERLLWPALPDREQMPFDFAWSVTAPRSREARRRAVAEYEGVPLELVRVELGEAVERHGTFTLYRRSRMRVRRTDTGEEGLLPLMDTLVEMGGDWKFMNFVDTVRERP